MSVHFYGSHVSPLRFLVRSSDKNLQFPLMVSAVLSKNLRMLVLVYFHFLRCLTPYYSYVAAEIGLLGFVCNSAAAVKIARR